MKYPTLGINANKNTWIANYTCYINTRPLSQQIIILEFIFSALQTIISGILAVTEWFNVVITWPTLMNNKQVQTE